VPTRPVGIARWEESWSSEIEDSLMQAQKSDCWINVLVWLHAFGSISSVWEWFASSLVKTVTERLCKVEPPPMPYTLLIIRRIKRRTRPGDRIEKGTRTRTIFLMSYVDDIIQVTKLPLLKNGAVWSK
jgi:hypothetical protein